MYNKNILFDYYNENSIIHRLHPIYKILSVIFMVIFLAMSRSVMDFVIVNLFILVMIMFSDISINVYLNNLRICKMFFLISFIFALVISRKIITTKPAI